jgi:hypothetical protein
MNMNKHVNGSSSSQQQLEDETLVKNLVDRFENVWNQHVVKAITEKIAVTLINAITLSWIHLHQI